MSARWFRFYADAMRNPKVAKLTDRQFRWWVNLLAVASENDGVIPCPEDLVHILKVRLDHASSVIEALLKGGLIDASSDGYTPHNWNTRQYKSDTSTNRVRKFRKNGNVSETAPDTDTDTDVPLSKDNGASPVDLDKIFWDAAKAYLRPHVKGDPGAFIGKWVREHGRHETARALTAAQAERAVEPVQFIQSCFRQRRQQTESGSRKVIPM